MLIPNVIEKYKVDLRGIIHIGAHDCEEIEMYEKFIPRSKILWIEAIPEKVKLNKLKYPNLLIENVLITDKDKELTTFNISNNGQSSSIFQFGTHKKTYPQIKYIKQIKIESTTMTSLLQSNKKYEDFEFNFINLDIQGAELKALRGMEFYLENGMIEYIYTEVSSFYVYKQGCLISELDEYLKLFGFERIETKWVSNAGWGDAFYIKKLHF